jgi:class 3 adenylate cyclase/tetratricopeptide (TPR) repeat protein
VICPTCAAENVAGAKFCNECGAALAAGCPTCGATNKPGARFCNECGAALGPATNAAPAVASAQAPVAERRLVTVMFTDLVGFTPFAEERDAEDVRDTLSRYFDMCSEIVVRYGGTVEKFIGDAVMAVWGAPVAHEDDAERAVRAALDLVESVANLAPGAQARAGVLTGEAAVTLGATNQGMVAGDLVNTAARLQSVAQPGTVLVGEVTSRAAGAAIQFEPAGDQVLKGKQAPVPAWRATRVVAELGGRNRSANLEAPFVGRADELRLLKDLFHATGREKRIRLVSVLGPAGIGKSRLAWEFSKYTDGLVEDTYWHSGRSPSYGEGVTFWALGEMIRRRCELVESDDEATTREKVNATVEQWIADADEREWIKSALMTLLGHDEGMASEQLFAAWRTFFERIAEHGTVALIFEDMHFADSGLLDFVDHLLEWSRGLPIFILTLSRPEILDRRADWGAGKRSFTSIHLEPLSTEHMHELLAGLVPGLPRAAATRIVERADGIPLYAVETVRMLISDGRLRLEGDFYAPVDDLETVAVPETLTALIASRLDALDPMDRSLVHDAAVLGQSFSAQAVAALSGTDVAVVEERLRGLARREIVGRDVDPRSPERGQYAFVQALIREVAYNTLARRDRRARHLAAARYFESVGSDELAGALAGHYLAAHANAGAGPEADALAVQARIALKAAADRAAALGAQDQAVSFLEQSLDITPDDVERADLLERAGRAAKTAGRVDNAGRFYGAAIEIYERAGDREGAARSAAGIAEVKLNARHIHLALPLLETAWSDYADLWPSPSALELRLLLARAYAHDEQNARALEAIEEVLKTAEHSNLVPVIARGLIVKGTAYGSLGRLREAVALLDAAERLARESSLNEPLTAALLVGGFHLNEIDLRAALAKYREGAQLARRTGQRLPLYTFINNIAYTGFTTGEWDEAMAVSSDALRGDVEGTHRAWLIGNEVSIRASRGENVEADMAMMRELAEGSDDGDIGVAILDAEANAWLAQGRLREAAEDWRKIAAIQTAQAPGSFYQAARAALWAGDVETAQADLAALDGTGVQGPIVATRRRTVAAGIAALEGRIADATALYREALQGWKDVGMGWDEALTGLDMVLLIGADANAQVASATRAVFERLGARPYLERLDGGFARTTTSSTPMKSTPVGERV